MPISRTQIVKELEPGLNAIFGDTYDGYDMEHEYLFDTESSVRAFEEEVLFPGFGAAVVKPEGAAVTYVQSSESYVARYNHETVALAFAITEEAMEDNLYESLSARLSRALARSMAHTKQVKAANVYNNAFSASFLGGDNVSLLNASHPMINGTTQSNILATAADLSETALETALIDISNLTDDRGIPIALQAQSLHVAPANVFVAERLLMTPYRVGTADNDINAIHHMGMFPKGFYVNHRFTDTDAWFIRTDCPDSMKHFERLNYVTKMEGEFESGNMRYKARERYSFGWSDWRGLFGTAGAA
jgi:hypothetical protein